MAKPCRGCTDDLEHCHGLLTVHADGWIDCSANGSTIGHSAPYAVHCVLPGVDAHLDTLTVSAAR